MSIGFWPCHEVCLKAKIIISQISNYTALSQQIIREANFSGGPGRVFPFSKGYAAWETDEIISMELYRNVALAFLCIFLTTLPLLSDLLGCAEVLLSVVLTMVNVSGLMHFWGKRFQFSYLKRGIEWTP